MYEIDHYFTPLLDKLEEFDQNDWYLHPVINLEQVKILRDKLRLEKSVGQLNFLNDRLIKISSDFLVVNFYGRQTGRQFLLEVQKVNPLEYNNQLRKEVLDRIGVPLSDFKNYREFSKNKLKKELFTYQEEVKSPLPVSRIVKKNQHEMIEVCQADHERIQRFLKRTA